MREKDKYSFVLDGVKYSDISGYISQYSKDNIVTGVAGTAQMIRQFIKQNYPNIPAKDYVWVNSRSFANGNSIDVYLNNAPEDFYIELKRKLNARFEYGKFDGMTDSYNYTKSTETTEDGRKVDYGTKYLSVDNRKPYDSKSPDLTPEDWKRALKKESQQANPMPKPQRTGRTSGYSMGDTLMECSGWTISKKILPDGRIVYNAKINPTTGKNTSDWNTIKGEIYTETAFKWGRFGAFEKWGTIASEAAVVQKLCEILGKYYDGGTSSNAPQQEPTGDPTLPDVGDKFRVSTEVGGKIYEIVGMAMGIVEVKPVSEEWVTQFGFTEVKDNFKEGRWFKVKDYDSVPSQPESNKKVEVNVNGMWFGEYDNQNEAVKAINEEARASKYEPTIFTTGGTNNPVINLTVITRSFEYGKSWDVPAPYGNDLQVELIKLGFFVHVIPNGKKLIFNKINSGKYTIIDNGGEFNLDKFDEYLTSISYSINNRKDEQSQPVLPSTLASIINDIVEDEIERDASNGGGEPQPAANQPTGKSKQDIEKAIKGLQYLADKGNEKAIKAIKGLKYLLNK